MRNLIGSILLLSMVLVTSCVQSLYPIYSEQDVIFDRSIIGTWAEKGVRETWTISASGGSAYKLSHKDENGKKADFDARLVKFGDHTFLDISPVKPAFRESDFYRNHFLATHSFVHVVSIGPAVNIAYLDPKWLKDLLAERPDAIRHERVGGEILLTASTSDIQKFLIANINTRGAFSPPIELTRAK